MLEVLEVLHAELSQTFGRTLRSTPLVLDIRVIDRLFEFSEGMTQLQHVYQNTTS